MRKMLLSRGGGAKLIGERDSHSGGTAISGLGLTIQGSSNIIVCDLHAEDFWGDGFFVGATPAQAFSQNILLDHISADNNQRNGLSLVSARQFRCIDSTFTNSNGSAPEAGIDIEPNYPTDYLEDIEFARILTRGNISTGMLIYLTAMDGSANPVGILVDKLHDDGSGSGITVAFGGSTGLSGLIRFTKPHLVNAERSAFNAIKYHAIGPRVMLSEPIFEDWNRIGGSVPKYNSGVSILADANDTGTQAIGNITIDRPSYILNTGSSPRSLSIYDERGTRPNPPTKIRHLNPMAMPAELPYWTIGVADAEICDDEGRSAHAMSAVDQTIGAATLYSVYNVDEINGDITIDINNAQPIGAEIEFVLGGATSGVVYLRWPAGVQLYPDTLGANRSIFASVKGDRVKLRKVAAMEWQVISRVGTWALS